jgi:hypothetical protein
MILLIALINVTFFVPLFVTLYAII